MLPTMNIQQNAKTSGQKTGQLMGPGTLAKDNRKGHTETFLETNPLTLALERTDDSTNLSSRNTRQMQPEAHTCLFAEIVAFVRSIR